MPRTRRSAFHRVTSVAIGSVALITLLVACTPGGDSPDPPSSADQVAMSVQTVSGGERLGAEARTAVETAVGEVLSQYVSRAYLGDFPRNEFVPAFASFSSRAASSAARDISLLTAAPVQDASSVHATRLDSRLSLLVTGTRVLGATAAVDFAFEALMPDGEVRSLTLRGRFMLSRERSGWSVFGYDLASDDGGALAESS